MIASLVIIPIPVDLSVFGINKNRTDRVKEIQETINNFAKNRNKK